MYGNSGVGVITRVYCMGGGFQNAELFSEELSTGNVVSSSYTWYIVLCMYICMFVCGWLAWSIYISCRAYTAVSKIACGLWGTTHSLSSIRKGLFSYSAHKIINKFVKLPCLCTHVPLSTATTCCILPWRAS